MKNTIFLFEDMKITVFNKSTEEIKEIYLEPGLIEDGEILDLNYLFYLIKKFLENKYIVKEPVFVLNSSKFLKCEIDLSEIKKEEYSSYIYYEIQKLLPINIDEYFYTYEVFEGTAKIRLARKNFIEQYINLSNHLKLNLKGIYYVFDSLKYGDYINYSVTHTQVIEQESDKLILCLEILKILKEYGINGQDFENIVLEKFVGIDSDITKKIEKSLCFGEYEKLDSIKKLANKKDYVIFGDFPARSLENSFNLRDLNINDFELKLNFLKKNKNKFLLPLVLLISLLILNSIVYISLNKKVSQSKIDYNFVINESLKENKNKLEGKNSKINLQSKTYEKDFEKLVLNFENYSNDSVIFTDYYFSENSVRVLGIADSTDIFKEVLALHSNTKVISSQVINDDIHFEIEILLEGLNENR